MTFETSHQPHPSIDIPRLFEDLAITDQDLERIANLNLPPDNRVTSEDATTTRAVEDALHIVGVPEVNVLGFATRSNVDKQPFGLAVAMGTRNRLDDALDLHELVSPNDTRQISWFSIENGLFSASPRLFTLSPDFDQAFDYADRAVAIVKVPGFKEITRASPPSESVPFPWEAIMRTRAEEGGFAAHTVGETLMKMGIVQDAENPHLELTANRPGGPLSRQDQIARVVIRALLDLTHQAHPR